MRFFPALTLSIIITACHSPNPTAWIAPHHMDIQQGNAVTEDMTAKIKPGMTRNQVRFLLGSPLITDLFHSNRWDYKYQLYEDGKKVADSLFTVYFSGDVVDHVKGSAQPAAPVTSSTSSRSAPPTYEHSQPVIEEGNTVTPVDEGQP